MKKKIIWIVLFIAVCIVCIKLTDSPQVSGGDMDFTATMGLPLTEK